MKPRQFISQQLWTLQRFGLTPQKQWARLGQEICSPIICLSVPKAGTHLLERALCLHPLLSRMLCPTIYDKNLGRWGDLQTLLARAKRGHLIITHLTFSAGRYQAILDRPATCIFMVRDPRDIVISQAFYISSNKRHRLHDLFQRRADTRSRLLLAISGCEPAGLPSIGERLAAFAGWLAQAHLTVRFEDLVGPMGGGEPLCQLATLRTLYECIGLVVDENWITYVGQNLFSRHSPTFRRGVVGQWKQLFDEEIKASFKDIAGPELISYGYESDYDW